MITEIDERRGCTSASNAAADLACPGRHLAQRGIPDSTSKDSEYGRLIHAALTGDVKALPALSLEQRETFDRCRELEKRFLSQMFPDVGNGNPLKIIREQRFWVKVPAVPGDMSKLYEHSGQPDLVARCGPQAVVIDYKTLPGEVAEPSNNLQLRDYAVLVKGHLIVDEVATLIIQPLATSELNPAIYGPEDLQRAEQEMFERIRRSNDPASARNASEMACKFCKAKPSCSVYQRFAGAIVPQMLNVLDVPMANWSPEQRAMFCDKLAVAQAWLDDAKELIKAGLAKDPDYCPGWYLKPGNKLETIINPQEVYDRFAKLGGNVNQFMAAVKVAKTKLREAVNEVTGAKGQALDKAIKVLTEGLVEVSQNAPSLKRKDSEDPKI